MSSPSRQRRQPGPSQTPISPPLPSSSTHKRPQGRRSSLDPLDRRARRRATPRDVIADEPAVQQAMQTCQFYSGNNVLSCFPSSDTSIPQHEFASFVWNSRLPEFTQFNLVNIYLFSATSQQILLQWHNVTNPVGDAGVIRTPVNDTWWGDRGSDWNGTNQTFLFYWVVTRADKPIDNTIQPQPIFTAVQTTFADSVVASMSSTSAAAASSRSAASLSSALAASSASALSNGGGLSGPSATPSPGSTNPTGGPGSGNVQNGNGGSSFPHWAIAVIVVLGFLALLATVLLTFLIMRRMRRRQTATLSHRGSMGSATPMMANANHGEPSSPIVASGYGAVSQHRPPSPDMHDGASTLSRTSDAALFSGADAAVMADAFRTALRKPNFADRPVEEGESPESDPTNSHPAPGLLDQALAEEGRDIRSVSSSRGVKVETLSDAADDDTVQDHDHPQ